MSLFECEDCGKTTNTAMSNYWFKKEHEKALCLDCMKKQGKKVEK